MKYPVPFRAWAWTLPVLAVLALATGCGVSPEGVAEEFATRFAERSFENLDKYVAADQRAEFRDFLAEYQAGLADPRNPGQKMLADMVLSIQDVEAEMIVENETTAKVRLLLEVEAEGAAQGSDAPFLDTPNQAFRITEATATGSLDIMLVKEKGRWMIDLMASAELWEDDFDEW